MLLLRPSCVLFERFRVLFERSCNGNRCEQTGWNLTCSSVVDACLALVSGHVRLGECLQDLADCRGRDTAWAADLVLDFRHMDFLTQFWARHGGVIDVMFDHRTWFPACWPAPMMRDPSQRARELLAR